MSPLWEKWCENNVDMFMRHAGTTLLTFAGLSIKNWQDLKHTMSDLGLALLTGAVVPTVTTILQKGWPKDEDQQQPTQGQK